MTSTALLALVLVAALVWVVVRLVQLITADGRGHRPPPASHRDWTDHVHGVAPR